MIPVATFAVAMTTTVLAGEPSHDEEQTQAKHVYIVVDGKVDASTYRGWRVFHYNCYGCHGIGAVGTDIAPDLTERVKNMSQNTFATIVRNRYRIVVPAGEGEGGAKEAIVKEMQRHEAADRGEIIMPAWERTLREKPTLQDLYAYLRARADGALGPDMPGQLDEHAP
jgi:mono/diheme cytochrome c family protein